MSKTQRTITTVLWGVLVLAMVGVISAGLFRPRDSNSADSTGPAQGYAEPMAAFNKDVPDFSLVDQDGHAVSKQSLMGSVWIADFIFTSCAGPCQEMTKKFNAMQNQLDGSGIKFVSFSVDPERDTPSVLKAYSADYGANLNRWSFLTGDKSVVYGTAKGMMLNVIPGTENTPLEHSLKFVLIDANGKLQEVADSKDNDEMAKFMKDAQMYAADAKKAAAGK